MPRRMNRRLLNRPQVRQVQKIINANKDLKRKWIELSHDPSTTAVVTEATAISEGDNFDNRIDDTIRVHSMYVQWCYNHDTTAADGSTRLLVLRARYGQLDATDIPAVGATPDYDKLQVYYDEVITFEAESTEPVCRTFYKTFKNKKIPHMKVKYDDDVSATDAVINPLYVASVGDGANAPRIKGYVLVKYFDP